MTWLTGNRTYIVAVGVIVASVVAFLQGEMSLTDAVTSALTGLGLGTLRAGIANK